MTCRGYISLRDRGRNLKRGRQRLSRADIRAGSYVFGCGSVGGRMDKTYLKTVLDKLERMKAVHSEKFSDNPQHANCDGRFDKAIDNLKDEMGEGEEKAPRLDFSVSQTALPDAIEPAARLEEKAKELEDQNDPSAAPIRQESRQILFKELNELDGFDR
jgi:hypothetical protein